MVADVASTQAFYAGPQGRVVTSLIRARLNRVWPDMAGKAVLGMGFAGPSLAPWRTLASRCIALSLEQMGALAWPEPGSGHASLSTTAREDALPFPDLSFDRVLLVHGLESAENAQRLLREIWRVLRDDGRLLVVVPNRRGIWAHRELTPFGQGQPYSAGQVTRLLNRAMFRVTQRDTALYLPPTRLRLVLRGAHGWERIGRALAPQLAGITLTEAAKEAYGLVPTGAAARRRFVLVPAGGAARAQHRTAPPDQT
jgi:SAM-dependent methyltransferase